MARKILRRSAWAFLALGAVASAWATQSPCSTPLWEIASPQPDAQVQGLVEIRGSACLAGDFNFYKLEYQGVVHPGHWVWVFSGDREIVNGVLGYWDTTVTDHGDGVYQLVLSVVRRDGNFVQTPPRRVVVANLQPLASPSPEGTLTPSPGPETPTSTIIIPIPTAVRIEATPITLGIPTPNPTRGTPFVLPEAGPFFTSFLCGALLAVVAFGILGTMGLLLRRLFPPQPRTRL